MSLKESLLLDAEFWYGPTGPELLGFGLYSWVAVDDAYNDWRNPDTDEHLNALNDETTTYLALLIAETIEE